MDSKELLDRFGENVAVSRAFGPAYEKDGVSVIPVAIVAGGGGAGGGSGRDGEEGEGGGFGGLVYPIGVYVLRDGGAKFVPTVNASRLAASAIGLGGTLVSRTLRRRKVARKVRGIAESRSAGVLGRGPLWHSPDPSHHHRGETFRLARRLRRSSNGDRVDAE
jgi:uncharacterized spore protein YtfJ